MHSCPLLPAQVEVYKSFRPGDIVLAKVVSFPVALGGPTGPQGLCWARGREPFP